MSTAGLMCPRCGGTFRVGFERCANCKVDLVDRATYEAGVAAMDDPLKALEGKKTVPVVHASLSACREIEKALLDKGIACALVTDAEDGDVLAAGAMKIGVIVAEDDLPRVAELMKARFESLIHKEGVGTFKTDAIDVTADEVECPACGHKAALKAGECADCGLFLGAPD